ncbi:MAG: hypothetical protein WBA77_14890 [Microcoleaceae cyanobacterium]
MTVLIKPYLSKFAKLILLLSLIPGLYSCETLTQSTTQLQRRLRIAQIANLYPKRKVGAKVYVEGTVITDAPFVGAGAYELQDSTGSVWVFTTEALPEVGDEMLIRAKVEYESITVEELKQVDIGEVYLQELERIE